MNKMNNSALFEYVTYEFMKRPKLAKLLEPTLTVSGRKKRSPRTFDVVIDDPFRHQSNGLYIRKVQNKLESLPSGHHFYTTVTVTKAFEPPAPSIAVPSPLETIPDIVSTEKCIPGEQSCDESATFRTYNGRCNNLENPSWGESNTPHRRLLPPQYEDSISIPRQKSVRGSKLPNARKVSQEIHTNEHVPDPKFTLMLMQWGQFLDHDMTHTPMIRGHDNSILDCNSCRASRVHPACDPIRILEGDTFFIYNRVDPKCIPFTRSVSGQQELGIFFYF